MTQMQTVQTHLEVMTAIATLDLLEMDLTVQVSIHILLFIAVTFQKFSILWSETHGACWFNSRCTED